METSINLSATGLLLILVAASSLFVMFSLNHINYIVHGELYNFGLQFSYRWAMPYWIFSGMVFSFCWVNILLSIVLTFYLLKKNREKAQHSIPQNLNVETQRSQTLSEKSQQSKLSEYDTRAATRSTGSRSDVESENEPSKMDTEQPENILQISIVDKTADREQEITQSDRSNETGEETTLPSDVDRNPSPP
ncbi:MAG: hypothetical protein NWF11_08470 [Candidatus Bathyarchaeota archaeon]|nr:hypothetical protein [Candidatus Bathyarchaeota archaeon]